MTWGVTMAIESSHYAEVYRVLSGVKTDGLPHPGAPGVLFNVIDRLRIDKAPDNHVKLAENVSVAILRLEGAVRNGRHALAVEIRAEIEQLNAAWMETPIFVAG